MAGFQANRYQPNSGANKATGAQHTKKVANTGNATGSRNVLFRTGLFKSDKEGVKSLASALVKEAITIPAGSYINLYANDDKKTDASPDFSITVVELAPKA